MDCIGIIFNNIQCVCKECFITCSNLSIYDCGHVALHSREGSPVGLRTLDSVSGVSTFPRKLAPLTKESMLKLHVS